MNVMPRAKSKRKELTREERRERRLLRREKQRKDNIGRAAKMHAARLQMEREDHEVRSGIKGIRICRLFRLVLLEMAGIILSR